jgi:hypothetical protein
MARFTGAAGTVVKVWDVMTRKERLTTAGPSTAAALSADGKTVASGNWDGTVKILDVATGMVRRTLQHTSSISAVALSTDGKTLVTGTRAGEIGFWDLSTGKHLVDLIAFDQGEWVAIDPDGRFDGSPRGMAWLYGVAGMETIDLARLTERYYEPGLVQKSLGFDHAPLHKVTRLSDAPCANMPRSASAFSSILCAAAPRQWSVQSSSR